MSRNRRKWSVQCTQCEHPEWRHFNLEKNREDWVRGHERLRNHTEVERTTVEFEMCDEEWKKLMKP